MIRTYSNLEDLFEDLQRSAEAVEAQGGIPVKVGDYVVRVVDPGDGHPLPIYGHLTDPMDYWRDRAVETMDEETRQEYEYERRSTEESVRRGYYFGTWYSVMCPDGEMGDAHVSTLNMVISREQFDAARAAGWAVMPTVPSAVGNA